MSIALVASIAAAQRRKPLPPVPSAPTLVSIVINAAGTSATLTFTASVSIGAGGNGGPTISMSGGAATLSYASGGGSTALVYTPSRTINSGETGTHAYTQPGNGIEATSGGIDVATYSGVTVTNNSTQGATGDTTFNSYYTSWTGFTEMAASGTTTRSYSLPSKPARGSGYATAGLTDAISSMRMYRITNFSADGYGSRARHNYSRKTPTNYDDSKVLILGGAGFYYIVNLTDFTKYTMGGSGGSIPGFAQDCEPIWHPTDPDKIWYTAQYGGLTYSEMTITTGASTTLFTLSGKLPSGYGSAVRAWTKDEGRPSRDGRYWCLMVEDSSFNHIGIICYDRQADAVIGYITTTSRPDHCSMSPLGNYMVISWDSANGTRSYARDYIGTPTGGGVALLNSGSEHSDLAVGADGTTEWYICADYSARGGTSTYFVFAKKLSDGTRIDLMQLYPVAGEDFGIHFCGNASIDKPGWVLFSTYSSGQNYGATRPASNARLNYETIFWCPIEASPTLKIVSENHARPYDPDSSNAEEYFNEPQAATNRYGTKIFFASNWNGRTGTTQDIQPDLYMIGAPSDWDTR